MRKKFLAVIMAITFLSTSCTTVQQNSDTYKITLEDMEVGEINIEYFKPVVNSTVTARSWSDASEILPEFLVSFFGNKTQLSKLSSDSDPAIIPAELLESFVQTFFDVESEHIRKASNYNKENNTYALDLIGGSPAYYKIVKSSMDENVMSIVYEYYDGGTDEKIREGTLKIEFIHKLRYKYISCDTVDLSSYQ